MILFTTNGRTPNFAAFLDVDGDRDDWAEPTCNTCARPLGCYGDTASQCVLCREDLGNSKLDRLRARAVDAAADHNATLVEMLEDEIHLHEHGAPGHPGSLWVDERDGSDWRLLRAGPQLVQLQRPHRSGPRIDRRVRREAFIQHYACVVP